jgi:hypothetical protein
MFSARLIKIFQSRTVWPALVFSGRRSFKLPKTSLWPGFGGQPGGCPDFEAFRSFLTIKFFGQPVYF